MVKNVARPPRTSRLTVEPRSEILKYRSRPFRGSAATVVVTFHLLVKHPRPKAMYAE
jgi:hypothetical protein